MTELAREYGEGLYELALEEGMTSDVLSQMKTLKDVFRQEPDFLRLLGNMSLSKEERVGVIDKTLRGQVHAYVLNFLKILCERGVLSEFAGCEEAYRTRYNADNDVTAAVATTAEPMTAEQSEKLIERLRQMTGKQIELIEKVDSAVMGGVLLEMNGKRYDNTVRHRLAEIRDVLTGRA